MTREQRGGFLALTWFWVLALLGSCGPTPAFAQAPARYRIGVHRVEDTVTLFPVIRRYGKILTWYGRDGAASLRSIDSVATRPEIREFLPDRRRVAGTTDFLKTSFSPTPPDYWPARMMGADLACRVSRCGEGVTVGVMDSGCGPHPDVPCAGRSFLDYTDSLDVADDQPGCGGHGTFVISEVHAIAPRATVVTMRISDFVGSCGDYLSTEMAAIRWAIDQHIHVLSLSAGGGDGSESYRALVKEYVDAGGVFVALSGNTGGPMLYPGLFPESINVGSVDANGMKAGSSAWTSTTGKTLDVVGPGVGVPGAMPGGGYTTKNGTSMSTPNVAGAFAIVLSEHRISADSMRHLACATAQPMTPPDQTGCGLVRPDRMLAALSGGFRCDGPLTRTYTASASDSMACATSTPRVARSDLPCLIVTDSLGPVFRSRVDLPACGRSTATLTLFLTGVP